MTSLITIIIAIVGSGTFGSLLTLFLTKKKRKAETLGIELDNANKVIKIWRELSEEQAAKIDHLEEKVSELITDIEAIKRLYEAQCNNCTYRKAYEEQQK